MSRPRLAWALAGTALAVVTLAGCAAAGSPSPDVDAAPSPPPSPSPSPEADLQRLDEYALADLLPTSAEVEEQLGWSDDVAAAEPGANSSLPDDIDEVIAFLSDPIPLEAACAEAMRSTGAVPGVPIGATEIAAGRWADEAIPSVRDQWLTRHASAEQAAAQVAALQQVIEECPMMADRSMSIVPTGVEGAVAFTNGAYSFVVTSYGNLMSHVEVGTNSEELAAGDALTQLQLDKLDLVARGEY